MFHLLYAYRIGKRVREREIAYFWTLYKDFFLLSGTGIPCIYEDNHKLAGSSSQRVYQYLKRYNSIEGKHHLEDFIYTEGSTEDTSEDWIQTVQR